MTKSRAILGLQGSRLQRMNIVLAGLFLVTLVGFVAGALSTSEGTSGDTVTTGLLWLYLSTCVALPLSVLGQAGYSIVDRVRVPERPAQSTRNAAVSTVLHAVELGLAVVTLLVEASLGYLLQTQPGGEGAGAIVLGAGLLVTLLGSGLAVTVLAGGAIAATRSRTTSTANG